MKKQYVKSVIPPRYIRLNRLSKMAFTLIEISIVLVIIGFIVGGILVGGGMINAAAIRSQISQIEKYNTAARTFQVKYGYLPGDIPDPWASNFGFSARGPQPGMGNGDGIIAGFYNPNTITTGIAQSGEPTVFWVDLSKANMIDGTFNTASPSVINNGGNCTITTTTTPNLNNYFPVAKIGQNNYVTVWSGGWSSTDSTNYFSVSSIANINCWATTYSITNLAVNVPDGISVAQAYNIDVKIDDGLPQSGRVMAISPANEPTWAGLLWNNSAPWTTATAGSSTTCFDNSSTSNGTPGVAGAAQHYSLEISSGNNQTCALSFKFQ